MASVFSRRSVLIFHMNNELMSNPGAAPPSLSSLGDSRLPLPKDYYIEFLLLGAFSGLLLPAVILPILLTVLPLAEPVATMLLAFIIALLAVRV